LVERSTNRNHQTSHREGDDVRHDRAVTILHETEIDGVRCYWVATERPTLAATLLGKDSKGSWPVHVASPGTPSRSVELNAFQPSPMPTLSRARFAGQATER
jgi:hypothetical protein